MKIKSQTGGEDPRLKSGNLKSPPLEKGGNLLRKGAKLETGNGNIGNDGNGDLRSGNQVENGRELEMETLEILKMESWEFQNLREIRAPNPVTLSNLQFPIPNLQLPLSNLRFPALPLVCDWKIFLHSNFHSLA